MFAKPITSLICLLTSTSVLAASVVPPAATTAIQAKTIPSVVKIASLNGKTNPNHKSEIQMRPRETVQLTADTFTTVKGKLVSENKDARDFIWQIDNRPACDAARSGNCNASGIQVTHEGIAFALPENMAETMKVSVYLASDSKKIDRLVIRNRDNVEERARAKAEEDALARQEAAEEAAYQEQLQSERNAQVVSGIFGALVTGLSIYAGVKAQERREERRDEWRQRMQQPAVQAPAAPVAPSAPAAPQEHGNWGNRGDGNHGGGRGGR